MRKEFASKVEFERLNPPYEGVYRSFRQTVKTYLEYEVCTSLCISQSVNVLYINFIIAVPD